MSLTTDPRPDHLAEWEEDACEVCGSPMQHDQEWCLECGTARTLVHRAPDWRIPVAIVGAVVLVALVAFAIAMINLSNGANRSAQTVATSSASTRTAAASTQAATAKPAPKPVAVPGWPVGVSGWTVVLADRRRKVRAFNTARRFITAGIGAGVLNSSQHPALAPGIWVVFAGRYPDEPAALRAAAKLRARGYRFAHVVEVAPPGGI